MTGRRRAVVSGLGALLLLAAAPIASANVVISAVYPGGGNSGATFTNDFVELHNTDASPVDLSGWTLRRFSASGIAGSPMTIPSGTLLAGGGYFLIQLDSNGAIGTPLPAPDFAPASPSNLTDAGSVTIGFAPSVTDTVGYGAVTSGILEGTAATWTASNVNGLSRNDFGCADTNNNSADFSIVNPAATPRNTASTTHICPPTLGAIGNKTVGENSLLQFTISATDPDPDTLTYSASNLPSGATFDTGTHTFSWTPSFTQAGSYPNVHFEVFDGTATVSEDITITVSDTPTSGGGGGGTTSPSNSFTIGSVKGKKVSVDVPGPGKVDVKDANAAKKKLLLKPSSATANGAGTVQVALKLTKTAKKKLKQKGKVKVKAAITFTPTGGTANSQTKSLKVKK